MLTIKDLKLSYGKHTVLKDINLTISKGESLAIIGPSGCGKSTLLCAIAGLLSYNGGSILLEGEEVKIVQKQIGLTLQNNNLFPWLTVYKNLSLGLKARGYKKEEVKDKIAVIAKKLRIGHLLKRYPLSLSGGEKQRVAIGCILIWEPKLLLLDEPSSALDALHKEKFQDFILELQQQNQTTMLLVTHSIEEAVLLGKKILVLLSDGSYQIYSNELYGLKNMREHISYYQKCLELRRLLKLEEAADEN